MDIFIAGWIALLDTSDLACKKRPQLLEHFPSHMIDSAGQILKYAIDKDSIDSLTRSGSESVFDTTGLSFLQALWLFANEQGKGLEIDLKAVPIRQETVEICEYLDLDPYELLCSGCVLIGTDDPSWTIDIFEKTGTGVSCIGRFTQTRDRVVYYDGRRRYINKYKEE